MKKSVITGGGLLLAMGLGVFWMEGCRDATEKPGKPNAFAFREKLSAYGLFKGPLKDLQPA